MVVEAMPLVSAISIMSWGYFHIQALQTTAGGNAPFNRVKVWTPAADSQEKFPLFEAMSSRSYHKTTLAAKYMSALMHFESPKSVLRVFSCAEIIVGSKMHAVI